MSRARQGQPSTSAMPRRGAAHRRRAVIALAALALGLALAPAGSPSSAAGNQPDRLVIPRLHLNDAIGTSVDAGPALYPGSGKPGEPYTIAIAGHRTTHTRPFWSLDLLKRGDRISIVRGGVRFAYVVTASLVVDPTDWSVMRELGYERLVLTTCNPRFSARERLVVIAKAAGR